MKTKSLNTLDESWLYVESAETPMHVAGLMIFKLPENAGLDYFQNLFKDSSEHVQFYPPWNRRLLHAHLRWPLHVWVEDDDIDIDYHVRLSALPWPGGERELGMLIARLHSHPLDLRRPPWECHIIQGLEDGRFALYIKLHHSLMDGISAMRLLMHTLSKNPEDHTLPAFWAIPPQRRPKAVTGPTALVDRLGEGVRRVSKTVAELPRLSHALRGLLHATVHRDDPMAAPFKAARTMLNGRISRQRRVATQSFELSRLKAVARAGKCTLNDIVLAICGGALRRFLMENGALPDQALTAGIPVSVREQEDVEQGNAITFIIASLGTDIADPLKRLSAIKASTSQAKQHLQTLPKDVMETYTLVMMSPYILQLLSGLGGRTRPVFNLTISNVPGPQHPLYLRGAPLLASYPLSLIAHGQALNITCQSYVDTLNFGFIGCRESLPSMQRIAVYTGEALTELETLLALNPEAAAHHA